MKKVIFEDDYWSCGDGCCGESWSNARIYEDGKFVEFREKVLYSIASCFEISELKSRARFEFGIEDDEEFELEYSE
jgi:hypothetical protein